MSYYLEGNVLAYAGGVVKIIGLSYNFQIESIERRLKQGTVMETRRRNSSHHEVVFNNFKLLWNANVWIVSI